ncbi:unnamed protein product [Ostreobium quekettii]|uniref:Uncharacterized protein n=1 Tax=Ostreobium quekettii TaxID=121088 RepID=A0A8S1JA85_9CHLO|nr:unnamed protein product [Ostreobium quekettii]
MDSSADHNKNEYRRYQYSTAESDRRTGARGGENELRAKEKENDEVSSEARQLKHSVLSKERFIVHKEKQAEELKEKLLKSLSDASAKSKEIDDLRTAKRKLEGEKSTLNRQLGKLKEQLSVLSSKDSNINAVKVAELESETKSLRKELQTASTEVKTCTNIIRTKDKELEKAKCQVEDAARAVVRSKELQNQVADLQRQRDTARHEIKTLQQVTRWSVVDGSLLCRWAGTNASAVDLVMAGRKAERSRNFQVDSRKRGNDETTSNCKRRALGCKGIPQGTGEAQGGHAAGDQPVA